MISINHHLFALIYTINALFDSNLCCPCCWPYYQCVSYAFELLQKVCLGPGPLFGTILYQVVSIHSLINANKLNEQYDDYDRTARICLSLIKLSDVVSLVNERRTEGWFLNLCKSSSVDWCVWYLSWGRTRRSVGKWRGSWSNTTDKTTFFHLTTSSYFLTSTSPSSLSLHTALLPRKVGTERPGCWDRSPCLTLLPPGRAWGGHGTCPPRPRTARGQRPGAWSRPREPARCWSHWRSAPAPHGRRRGWTGTCRSPRPRQQRQQCVWPCCACADGCSLWHLYMTSEKWKRCDEDLALWSRVVLKCYPVTAFSSISPTGKFLVHFSIDSGLSPQYQSSSFSDLQTYHTGSGF